MALEAEERAALALYIGGVSAVAETLRSKLKQLEERQVFVGTSSWNYPGWCGRLYDEQRYRTRDSARFPRHRKAAAVSIKT